MFVTDSIETLDLPNSPYLILEQIVLKKKSHNLTSLSNISHAGSLFDKFLVLAFKNGKYIGTSESNKLAEPLSQNSHNGKRYIWCNR